MLYQKKENLGSTQSIWILTLREKSILSNSYYYTFDIQNRNSLNNFVFSPDDISPSFYYNRFDIQDAITQSFTGSVAINFEPGEYHYDVYQMQNQYDLDISNALKKVETGLLIVLSADTDQTIVFTQ